MTDHLLAAPGAEQLPETPKYCIACKRPLPGEAHFCPACGQPVALREKVDGKPESHVSPGVAAESGVLDGTSAAPSRPPGLSQHVPTAPLPSGGAVPETAPVVVGGAGRTVPPEQGASRARQGRVILLLGLLSGLLALALVAGGALAFVELDRRNVREQALTGQVASLTQANLDFQAQVQSLTGERERLANERDRLIARVGDLEKKNAEQEKRIQELTGQVQEQSRQLTQAREEATRQQQRAETAEEVGAVLTEIVLLDDKIHKEFENLFDSMLDMQTAYRYGDGIGFANAYDRGMQAAQRLDQLFAQRDRLLAQLGY